MTLTDAGNLTSYAWRAGAAGAFESLLFTDPRAAEVGPAEPECFADLHLDQIVTEATKGREEYELRGFYHQPLTNAEQVRYRQDVLDDLRRQPLRREIDSFAEHLRGMRRYIRVARQFQHQLTAQRWYLEAMVAYREAVRSLAAALERAAPRSAGLAALERHACELVRSPAFTEFAAACGAVEKELGELEYSVTLRGAHVQVDAFAGEQDELVPKVQATFARFAQGEVRERGWRFRDLAGLNHVEEQVLDRVARLFPGPFERLRMFCERYGEVLDEGLLRFDREVQFYLGYLAFIEPLSADGLAFCRPELSGRRQLTATGGFDLSLAAKLRAEGRCPVTNDVRLEDPERVLVVTGPNQGGKTTFARMIGQLYVLAALGLPVPAARASLALSDRVFTHFEQEESLETLRGKFEDELVRIHAILEASTDRSVLVMNESFGSTTLADGRLVGSEIARQIIDRGSLCVFVSFIDELASLGPETVSMMSTVDAQDPARRTFRIERKPADGLAYAAALANKYRLGYDDLRRRIGT
jgi:DNA mismatch repair protein MutS